MKGMHIGHSLTLFCIRMALILFFVIMRFPSQPRFGLTSSFWIHTIIILNLNYFLINQRIFMKIIAKFSAFKSLAYQVHLKVCNPNPFKYLFTLMIH